MSSEILLATAISNFLLVGIGGFFIYLSAKTEKLFQELQSDSVHHRREYLIELQEIRNAIIDLTDVTEDIEFPQANLPLTQPNIADSLPLPVQMGMALLKSLKEGSPDINGEKTGQRQVREEDFTPKNFEDQQSTHEETLEWEEQNQDTGINGSISPSISPDSGLDEQ